MQFKTTLLSLLPFLSTSLAESWSIENFTRDCTNPNICTYFFTINTGSSTQHCTTVDFYTPAGNHSWYDTPCEEDSNYHISWGWDYPGDFTVLTVVDEVRQLEAFFGYNAPNAVNPVASYPNVGPNAVQPTGAKAVAVVA
ncbi:uncharacterized protein LY89DRAFT_666584 [Mollisia scopiformis]|uniref:Uncharacterized protein n=1 Tax=Mollisia scopiformis TaxID=149040 RepID=A0A194XHN4_MOLSC|nr:uncharacterized protein LY89DRAFT_666584 [Mollisia scopiformis]KUJ19725.1 hypothetical protein LY89DRAFT_666584 [Mollisia scopiformis]